LETLGEGHALTLRGERLVQQLLALVVGDVRVHLLYGRVVGLGVGVLGVRALGLGPLLLGLGLLLLLLEG